MKYLVIARYIIRDKVWKTHQREFCDLESAREYAKTMYDGVDAKKGEEVIVLLYQLIESMN